MIRHLSLPVAITLSCFLLVSCATIEQQPKKEAPEPAEPKGWLDEKQKRHEIKNWEIRGRLGLQTEHNGGTMDIIWKQSGEAFTIRLMAPLGAGSYLIQGDENFAEIRFPDGEKQIVDNMDDVFASALDVDLPASAIKDWLRGLPASAYRVKYVDWNEQGLIKRVKQSGWNVEMGKYSGSSILLPHNIYVSRDDNSELDVRLILKQWLVDN